MIHEDDEMTNTMKFRRVDQSRPPLRWIANAFGAWGGYHILRCAYADEDGKMKLAKFHGKMFNLTYPMYKKWGTYYKSENSDIIDL